MPELPDITVSIEALEKRILGQRLEKVRIVSPFLLRRVGPPVASAAGKRVVELRRMGKRICIGLGEGRGDEDGRLQPLGFARDKKAGPTTEPAESSSTGQAQIWLVLHLMIAGRLHWGAKGKKLSKQHLAAFDFENGSLLWTEAGSQNRASVHLARGEGGLGELGPGGVGGPGGRRGGIWKNLKGEKQTFGA